VLQAREPAPTSLSASVVWTGRPKVSKGGDFLLRSQIGALQAALFVDLGQICAMKPHSRVETEEKTAIAD
jgi:hypothetical protein